jgi:hypothetical protein
MEKIYVGNHKSKEGQHGAYLMQSFKVSDLDMMKQFANEKGYVTLFTSKRREVGRYGETHSSVIAPPRDNPQPQGNPYNVPTGNVQANNPQPIPEAVPPVNTPQGTPQGNNIPF